MGDVTHEDYAARVPDRDVREEAARLWGNLVTASEARADAEGVDMSDDVRTELAAADAAYQEAVAAAQRIHSETCNRLMGPAIATAQAAEDAAQAAYDQHEGLSVLVDDDDEVIRCALSGVPLYNDDQVLETPDGNFKVLASLVLPDFVLAQIREEDE